MLLVERTPQLRIAFFWLLSFLAVSVATPMLTLLPHFDRDLKPTNVLLDEDDRPVLMDLGSMNRARIEVRAVAAFQAPLVEVV